MILNCPTLVGDVEGGYIHQRIESNLEKYLMKMNKSTVENAMKLAENDDENVVKLAKITVENAGVTCIIA